MALLNQAHRWFVAKCVRRIIEFYIMLRTPAKLLLLALSLSVCNECYIVRMIGPCNRQWHRLKMSVDVEYIPSCCIEKMHLHAAIFGLQVETEVVNEPTSAETISRFLNLHVHGLS